MIKDESLLTKKEFLNLIDNLDIDNLLINIGGLEFIIKTYQQSEWLILHDKLINKGFIYYESINIFRKGALLIRCYNIT